MFHDMRHTGIINWRRTETDGKDFIVIIIFQEKETGAAFFVLKSPCD
jgi:hypothetical protein